MFNIRIINRAMAPTLAAALFLAAAGSAVAESSLHRVEAELFESSELTASPMMIVEEGKSGLMVVGDTSFEVLLLEEEAHSRADLSLTVEVKRLQDDKASVSDGRVLIAPTLFLDDSGTPTRVSVGEIDLVARAQRTTAAEVAEL